MPFFSIVTPVYRPRPDHLQLTIDSIRAQTFTDWEWILVDDASGDAEVEAVLRNAAAEDPRIRVHFRPENGHIVAASNDGLDRADGQWIVFIDHDDLLVAHALERVAQAIADNPTCAYVYTDEDKIDGDRTLEPFRKPIWSPELLVQSMYLGHLSVMRADRVRLAGGFRPGYDGSQDHDLAFRVTEFGDPVVHIPEVLYHWRMVPGSAAGDTGAKDYALVAGVKAAEDHLQRVGRERDTVEGVMIPRQYRITRWMDPARSVSIVIPTRGSEGVVWGERRCFVTEAVRSVLRHTAMSDLEFVIVADAATPETVIAELRDILGERLTLVRYDEPFNYSRKCNLGFLASRGEYVVMLNDDIEVRSDGFLEQLLAPLQDRTCGMTGARLTYSDDTIQHAGLCYLRDNVYHAFRQVPNDQYGYFGALVYDHEVSGLTGACMAMRRDTYVEVGGFTEDLPMNFNDVDLSMKVRAAGYRLLWLARVWATHFESQTRVAEVNEWEVARMLGHWGSPRDDDYLPAEAERIYYSRLEPDAEDFEEQFQR